MDISCGYLMSIEKDRAQQCLSVADPAIYLVKH